MTEDTKTAHPTLAEFEDAAAALQDVILRTPLEHSEHLSDVLGAPVLLKLENLQRTGSFKIRGAYLRMSRLSAQEKANGVVAASAGNHAQGVALAAQADASQTLAHPATLDRPVMVTCAPSVLPVCGQPSPVTRRARDSITVSVVSPPVIVAVPVSSSVPGS